MGAGSPQCWPYRKVAMHKIAKFLLIPVMFFFIVAGAQPASAATYPKSMAALGDSISQATNACCWYGNHPAQSWSTGTSRYDGISSHYERLLALRPAIAGKNYNNSRSGAKASDLPGQAAAAAAQKAEYVTILIGANDLCTSTAQGMTSPGSFEASIRTSLATLDQMRPRPQVFVSSIPDVHHLWSVLRNSSVAQWVWSTAKVCQSMLSTANTDADRQLVVDRELAFNASLARVCQEYGHMCRHDGGAVYNYPFTANEVSVLDYFHPSLRGQAALAEVTWKAAGWS